MLPIQQKQIQYNVTPATRTIEYIVIHYTANYNAGAGALMHYQYFNGGNRNASADIFVDDKNIVQINDYIKNYTWAVGDGKGAYGITNRNSISIEICVNSDSNLNTAIDNTVALTAYLMKQLNLPIEKVVRHYDASRKQCPLFYVDSVKWNEFKSKVMKQFMKDYKQILAENSQNAAEWEEFIKFFVENDKNLGSLNIGKYLPALIEKLGNK